MTLYERYNTGEDGHAEAYGDWYITQTFTIGNTGTNEDHDVKSIKLRLYREGSPGTFTVSIRAVDVDGKPTGADLTSGTTNGNTLTTDAAGEWRSINVTPYGLSASTKYAIIGSASQGNGINSVHIMFDGTTPTYTGGSYGYSNDEGVSWDLITGRDVLFEEYDTVSIIEGQFMQPTRYW